jgi:hypothetical protein
LTFWKSLSEDIFAGFMANDKELLSRGELTLQRLLLERPQDKADIVAWQGWASLIRAMYAHEANNAPECADFYQKARTAYAEALQLAPSSDSVAIIIGASDAVLADRLPNEYRRAAWEEAYIKYRKVWKSQGAMFESFPLHLKGELLAGLTQTAQRSGPRQRGRVRPRPDYGEDAGHSLRQTSREMEANS